MLKYRLIEKDEQLYQCYEEIHRAMQFYFDRQELKATYDKAVNLINQILPRDVNLLDLYLADKTYYLNHIDRLYKLKDEYDYINDNLIALKVKQLEFIVTGARDGKEAKVIIREIEKLIVKNKGIKRLYKVKFWLAKSTYSSWFLKKYDLAIKQIEEVLPIIRGKNNYKIEDILALSKLTQIYSFKGNYEKVFYYAKQAQNLIRDKDINDGLKQVIYQSVSLAYRHQGHYVKALEAINRAIDLGRKGLNNYDKKYVTGFFLLHGKFKIMMKLGKNRKVLMELDKIERKVKQAYEEKSFTSLLDAIYALKAEVLLNLRKTQEAFEYIEKIDFSIESSNSLLWKADVYKLKGDIYRTKGKHQKATEYFMDAENIYNKCLSVLAIENISDLYISTALNFVDSNEINKAFKYKKKYEKIFGDTLHPLLFSR